MSTKDEPMPEAAAEQQDENVPKPPINLKNILNFVFYTLNINFTFGVGNAGWFANTTNSELSEKYQTLVTPNSSAFLIWSVIFLFQAVFAVVQLLPWFRANPLVQQGVGYYYMLTCVFQVGWTFAFSFEVIELALALIFSIWLSLAVLLYSQYYVTPINTGWRRILDYWLLRFPFAIHCGWLTAATLLNVNVVVVDQAAAANIQLAVGIVSLAVLHAISVWVVLAVEKPDYTWAGVLAWANWWIRVELENPKQLIVDSFAPDIISGVRLAATAVCFIIIGQIVLRLIYDLIRRFFCKSSPETTTEAVAEEHYDEESPVVPASGTASVKGSS